MNPGLDAPHPNSASAIRIQRAFYNADLLFIKGKAAFLKLSENELGMIWSITYADLAARSRPIFIF